MPYDPTFDPQQASLAELVQKMGDYIDEIMEGGGGAASGGGAGIYDINKAGVPSDGVTPIPAGTFQNMVSLVTSEFSNNAGKALGGVGVGLLTSTANVMDTVDFKNANLELDRFRLQAPAGATGTVVRMGRYDPAFPSSALSIPGQRNAWVWGGNRTTGINSNLTLIELDTDTGIGSDYKLTVGYGGVGFRLRGNLEKKRIFLRGAYVDLLVSLEQTVTGSTDTVTIDLTAINFTRLIDCSYGANGSDMSVLWTGNVEGHIARASDPDVIIDQNGKATAYDIVTRGYNGQGNGSYYKINQEQNDYADTFGWGGNNRHIHGYGRLANIQSVRNLYGPLTVKDWQNGRTWVPTANNGIGSANGAFVPVECVFVGRVINGGGFTPRLYGIQNSVGILWGNDTYFSIDCDFGDIEVSCGSYKPYNNEFPFTYTAARHYKGLRCYWPYKNLHGKLEIKKGIVDCGIEVPANWVARGYEASFEPGGVWTMYVRGQLTFAEALAAPWLSQISGEQRVVFESISDRDGLTYTYDASGWHVGGPSGGSLKALRAQASDINLYLKNEPTFGCRDNGLVYGRRADGSWVAPDGAIEIPATSEAATMFFSRLSTPRPAGYDAVIDRLLFQLDDIGALGAAAFALMPALGTDESALKALLPGAISGTWYDSYIASGTPVRTAKQGILMNPGSNDRVEIGYNMGVVSEGLAPNDQLMVLGTRRENPANTASANLYDLTDPTGRAKIRNRNNAESVAAGQLTTVGWGQGTTPMPDVILGGSIPNPAQANTYLLFGCDKGRVIAQSTLSTAAGGTYGTPGAMALSGSREIFAAAMFKASYFFTSAGGVVRPIGNRPLVLYRAFTEAYLALQKL